MSGIPMSRTIGSSAHLDSDHLILSVSSLSLHHFRNYESARIEISEAPVVLSGENGAGKTNILEALSLLIPGRGLRRARLSEMDNIKTNQPWALAFHINGLEGEVRIGTGRIAEQDSDKRLVKIDGKESRSQAECTRHMAMLWLTPQMEQLFLESASSARKFLDRLVYGFDPDHATRVHAYEHAMRERNKLLETGSRDAAWLDTLEQTMVETSSAIAHARLAIVEGINHAISASPLSFPKARLSVEGFAEEKLAAGEPSLRVEEALKHALETGRRADAAAGRALAGAHKSAFKVFHLGKLMPAEACSTGEQKALLLSIVLAEARFMALKKGRVPVLLLDEVAAHLDAIKRFELFEEICQIGAQAWMTGTDHGLFKELKGKAQFFKVENNAISFH